ncbi:unnamed protein product, partial [Didymodactylos carnosus]
LTTEEANDIRLPRSSLFQSYVNEKDNSASNVRVRFTWFLDVKA